MIVILTMVLLRYAVIEPVIGKIGVILQQGSGNEVPAALQFSLFNFILLVTATVFITAGGYVINDYFDIKTDLINKGKVIVVVESSASKVPSRKFKNNQDLTAWRNKTAADQVVSELKKVGYVRGKHFDFGPAKELVQGKDYENDRDTQRTYYEQYQYINLKAELEQKP